MHDASLGNDSSISAACGLRWDLRGATHGSVRHVGLHVDLNQGNRARLPFLLLFGAQDANETETMASLLADPGPLISSAIAEAKRWNVTGFNIDMEAPSPYGDQDTVVMEFVNTLSTALAEHGIQTSNCLGGINGSPGDAALLNRTAMRTVPMNLYNGYDSDWTAEVNFWRQEGMVNKLGIGFCPTCYASPEPDLAAKFKVAAAYNEIDFFAYGAGYGAQFAPYWDLMRDFLKK